MPPQHHPLSSNYKHRRARIKAPRDRRPADRLPCRRVSSKLLPCAAFLLLAACPEKPGPPPGPPPKPPPALVPTSAPQHSFGTLPRAGEQSLADAWKAFCAAQEQIGDLKQLPPAQQPARLAAYVHDHVRNQDFVFFIAEMQGLKPAERRQRYQEQLAQLGIARCEMGDWFFPAPDGG